MLLRGIFFVILLQCLHADEAHSGVPWYSIAIAQALHYIPVHNPMFDHNVCGLDFTTIDLLSFVDGKVGANFLSVEKQCRGVHDFRVIKVRVGLFDFPERGYDQPTVECLHLFRLDDAARSAPPPLLAGSQYGPPRFPRAFYLNNRLSLEASLCVSEFIEGVPIPWHVSSLRSDAEVADFALATIELGATLARHSILHRDIHPNNLLVHRERSPSGEDRFRLVLVDFTWAISPGIVQFQTATTYLNQIYGRYLEYSDAYSIGFLLHDLLNMFCVLDTSWLSPVIATLLEAASELNLKFTFDYNALGQRVLELLAQKSAVDARSASSEELRDPLALRREALCNLPNTYAPPPSIEKGYAFVGSDVQPAVKVTGYQHFSLYRNEGGGLELMPLNEGLQQKDAVLSPLLSSIMKGLSIIDVGGNFGFFSVRCMLYGATAATVVDMDTTHSLIAREMYVYMGEPVSRINIQNMKLKDITQDQIGYSADVVMALAFIHWSYNCSEANGNLAKTIGQLALRARKILIIEWVDPMDPAIQHENHLGTGFDLALDSSALQENPEYDDINIRNTSLTSLNQSSYSFTEFRRVMGRSFECVREVGRVSPTRRIFVGVRGRGRSLDSRGEVDLPGLYDAAHDYFKSNFGCSS